MLEFKSVSEVIFSRKQEDQGRINDAYIPLSLYRC